MEHICPFKFLKISNYFYGESECIKISETEACDRNGIEPFGQTTLVMSDPNHDVKGGKEI